MLEYVIFAVGQYHPHPSFSIFAIMETRESSKKIQIAVDVRVPAALREYVVCVNGGSPLLVPEKSSVLWGLLKHHLITCKRWMPIPREERGQYIQIALRYGACTKVWNIPSQKEVYINTLCRFYLDKRGQGVIAKYLDACFKASFRDYMIGALSNNVNLSVTEAINGFCSDYDITEEKILDTTLRKDWYRFRKRREKNNNLISILK